MVESIAAKSIAADLRVAAVVRARPAAPAEAQAGTPSKAAPSNAALAQTLAATLASSAPVDTARVAQIKTALANGTFPILPATIADQMLAYRYDWISNDAA